MSIELRLLAYAVALLFVIMLNQANVGVMAQGPKPMMGSRDNLPAPKSFQARTKRLLDNHIEGLVMFAPLVLIAAQQHISNDITVLGARLFFYSRVAHAACYLVGVPFLRTLAWLVGIVGTVMIFLALFGILQ